MLALLLLFAGGVALWQQSLKPGIPMPLQGMGDDFTLTSASGPVSLHDFRGKVVLVYFGYTHCPDVCPMALGVMAGALDELPEGMSNRAEGIFISLDPRRDTPEQLAKFTTFFSAKIHGLTGSPEQLETVADAWRVGFSVPDAPADVSYAVEHSTFLYLVNPEGKVAGLYDEKTGSGEIVAAIRQWLE